MPIYEYQCTSCHQTFDLMQKMLDAPAKQCPFCFKDTAIRLVSAAGFQLKGSGWYATDFKNKGKPDGQKKDTGSANSSTVNDIKSSTASSKTEKE